MCLVGLEEGIKKKKLKLYRIILVLIKKVFVKIKQKLSIFKLKEFSSL
jgi:hypothetical protein